MSNPIYHIAPKRSGHAFVGNMIKSWCPGRTYYDMEGHNPALDRENGIKILQTRDFLNWLASYSTYHDNCDNQANTRPVRAWYLITRFMNSHDSGFVSIVYDDFVVDQQYRKNICTAIGGTYDETMFLRVTDNGDGSTFDKMDFNGNADKMRVLIRYRQVPKKLYVNFFTRYPYYLKFYKKICDDPVKLEFLQSIGL